MQKKDGLSPLSDDDRPMFHLVSQCRMVFSLLKRSNK